MRKIRLIMLRAEYLFFCLLLMNRQRLDVAKRYWSVKLTAKVDAPVKRSFLTPGGTWIEHI